MKVQLDTSFLIHALAPSSPEEVSLRNWLRNRTPVSVSAIAWAELLCGPISASAVAAAARVVPDPLPLGPLEAVLAAELFNLGGRRRGSLGDCMIAATAIRNDARLATTNRKDFERFASAGLMLADV